MTLAAGEAYSLAVFCIARRAGGDIPGGEPLHEKTPPFAREVAEQSEVGGLVTA